MNARIIRTSTDVPQMPVTLDEVKAHLKVEHDSEDSLIQSYMLRALRWAEERTRRAIAAESYKIIADDFPIGCWDLPLGKIRSVDSVEYVDVDGNTQTWSSANYEVDLLSDFKARLRPLRDISWPDTGSYLNAATVTVTAGWLPADVPYTIRQALLLKVGDFFENRAPGDPLASSTDAAAEMLLHGWSLPFYC